MFWLLCFDYIFIGSVEINACLRQLKHPGMIAFKIIIDQHHDSYWTTIRNVTKLCKNQPWMIFFSINFTSQDAASQDEEEANQSWAGPEPQ